MSVLGRLVGTVFNLGVCSTWLHIIAFSLWIMVNSLSSLTTTTIGPKTVETYHGAYKLSYTLVGSDKFCSNKLERFLLDCNPARTPKEAKYSVAVTWTACSDGWNSPSIGRQGACSHHGGVKTFRRDGGFVSIEAVIDSYKRSSGFKGYAYDSKASALGPAFSVTPENPTFSLSRLLVALIGLSVAAITFLYAGGYLLEFVKEETEPGFLILATSFFGLWMLFHTALRFLQ